ncbi:MAG: translocation/assembly module TamB domain-containing protein, partial [Ketobacteraceae bacterium]|nr:translocation/assembly module TamB domain-containing protein [Ketobacteraceae bacterium]
DITADYENNRLMISGRVRVPRAFINIKSLPKNSVGVSSDVVIVDSEQQQTEMTPVYANVEMRLGSDVLFRGFGLESHLRGNMRLEYSPQQLLQGNGFVKLVDGTYKAYGQNLEIRSGELIFVGPIDNPTIYVDAVRADITDAVTVGIRAEGPAKNPSVTLFSQPAMSDNRKLHYLVTGQAPGEGEPRDSGALLSQAAISLGAATGESVLQDYADKLGIRNFQISAGEGESGAEVQLSGYINPRLFVRYGMGMFEEVNSLTMRYKLTRNLFLEAVSSTASTLDLLWTFKVGKSERSLRE